MAYWQWRNKELVMPEMQYPDSYKVDQVLSCAVTVAAAINDLPPNLMSNPLLVPVETNM